MLNGLVSGLLLGWILGEFGIDKIAIEVLQPFVEITLTQSHFYFIMGVLGLISGILKR